MSFAQWLEDFAGVAAENLAQAESQAVDHNAPIFRRFAVDVKAQIGLGRFFGKKLRAAVLYGLYDRTGNRAALEESMNLVTIRVAQQVGMQAVADNAIAWKLAASWAKTLSVPPPARRACWAMLTTKIP